MSTTLHGISLTHHAQRRLAQRGLRAEAILAAIDHGREVRTRGAWFHVVGHREVVRARREGVDISAHEGVHVLLGGDGSVITAYRNKNLDTRSHSRHRRNPARRTH